MPVESSQAEDDVDVEDEARFWKSEYPGKLESAEKSPEVDDPEVVLEVCADLVVPVWLTNAL